ncbi:hypothetical protein [Actinomadura rubrisoli]|uniref:4-hydroxy-3-methylbut-2-enyl diphosphate reductase n=1 Tax=Actinomadura rubrisoli TaxID=2530368 RepID=A0A4R5B8Q5_9ACTN|nr:hypothetical protein [Actinomadura rubrisoli]TDD82688.1 hypothetical protein E1298_22365 [Actinomadura rubrisoli]
MNRSLRRRQLRTTGIGPGELLVATGFTDPEHGPVRCAAAPAVAAAAQRACTPHRTGRATGTRTARRVRLAPAPTSHDTTGDAVLSTASYLDRQGRAAGFAVAAHLGDPAALAVAEQVMDRWFQTLRSRRLVLAGADPMCWGGRRAVELIGAALKERRTPVYMLDRPIADQHHLQALLDRGAITVDDLHHVPPGATVAFTAPGASLAARAEAAARGLDVLDCTCPLAAAAQADVRAYADRGDTVVVIGHRRHAASAALTGQAAESVVRVADLDDVAGLGRDAAGPHTGRPIDPARVSFVVQTGTPIEQAAPIIAALRARFPRLRGHHYDALCYAASDRAATIRAAATASDLMLVAGSARPSDARDPDTDTVTAEAARTGTPVHIIGDAGDLRAEWVAGADTIGLATTRAAPAGLPSEITAVLAGLGPLTVVTQRTGTRTTDPDPDRHDDAIGAGDRPFPAH